MKSLLFLSAFAPALLGLAYARYLSTGLDTIVCQLIIVSAIGCAFPFLILALIKKESEVINFTAKKVESADHLLIAFIVSYISPLAMKMADINFGVAALVVTVLFFSLWLMSNIPSHPILYLLGFRFYKVDSSNGIVYTLISRRNIRSPESIRKVKQISNSMLVE